MKYLNCNYALVTGASSGIGLAYSRELARRGFHLLLVSNQKEELEKTAAQITAEFKVTALHYYMDLAKQESAQELFDYCVANKIKIFILINNAGIFFFKDVIKTSSEKIDLMMNLHMYTPVMLSKLFAQQMLDEKRRGWILNMSSVAAWMMMPGLTFYNSTKNFMRSFSRSMRNEVFNKGISVITVCPGAVATGLYNLSPKYQKLGVALGIIIRPEKLAKKAITKLFNRRKEYMPGIFINRLFIFILKIMPECIIRHIKKKIDNASNAKKQ